MTESGFDLSFAQTQTLAHSDEADVRRVQLVVAIDTNLDPAILAQRFSGVSARYDVLHTAFVRPVGLSRTLQSPGQEVTARQVVHGGPLDDVRSDELSAPLDLLAGQTSRVAVTEDHLVLTASAAVADERSLRLIAAELLGGRPVDQDPLQFVDYSSWEAEQLADEGADARIARAYWTGLLGGDAKNAAAQPHLIRPQPVVVADDPTVSGDQWLAAWAAVLQRHGDYDADSVVVSVAVDGRVDADLENAIGPYERYIPLLVARDADATMADLTHRVRSDLAAAKRFSVFAPSLSTTASFVRREDADLTVSGTAFALELVLTGPCATLWHDPQRITTEEATRLAEQLRTFLIECRRTPQVPAARLDVRGPAERAFLAAALEGEATSSPHRSILAALAAQVAARPDAVAVAHGETELTFAELDRQTAGVAAACGADAGPTAVLLEHSADAVVAALGIVRSGAPYLTLDPSNPPGRWAEQVQVAGAGSVVTTARLEALAPDGLRVLRLEDIAGTPVDGTPAAADDSIGPDTTAYLMFTSGSTGTPKATAVTHANVLAYTAGVSSRLGLDSATRFATVTGMSTDLGNTAVFGALLNGGTLEIVPPDAVGDGRLLSGIVRQHGVTALKITPSHLRALLAGDDVVLPLQQLVVGGEALDTDLVAQARTAGVARVINHYGPTETTVGVFTHEVSDAEGDPIPIGSPLPHVRGYLRDAFGAPSALGAVGELCIGGPSVSAGYVGRPEETSDKFVDEPGHPGRRIYRTGDRVRVRPDGLVEFRGRGDDQVKIRGFRVEPGEIETRLRWEESVAEAVVVADADAGTLVGYVVSSAGEVDASELLERLADRVPPYMVPSSLVQVAELPRMSNGKVDRRRLAAIRREEPAKTTGREPATETERELLEIWRQVLPPVGFGVDDNFFQVGGHSLLATRVIARSRAQFDVDLPLHVIFASPTVSSMAAEIDHRRVPADDDLADLLADLEQLSDEEAERLLRAESSRNTDDL